MVEITGKAARALDDIVFDINQELVDRAYAWIGEYHWSGDKGDWAEEDHVNAKKIYKAIIKRLKFEDFESPRL